MPFIPLVQSKVSLEGVEKPLDRSFSETKATAAMYGSDLGAAIQSAGNEMAQHVNEFERIDREKKNYLRSENVANAVAQTDLEGPALNARLNAPPDGTGVVKATFDAQRKVIDEEAARRFPDDPRAASEYKTRMYGQQGGHLRSSVDFQFQRSAEYAKEQANKSLYTLQNKMRLDNTQYDNIVATGDQVISSSTAVAQGDRETMRAAWPRTVANARFEGMLSSARTTDELDAIEKELTAKDSPWQERLLPNDFEKLLGHIKSGKKAFATKADADARVAIESMEARSKDNIMVPREELAAAEKMVRESGNSILTMKLFRVVRDQDMLSQAKGLPPSEIFQMAGDARGGAGRAYPNLPAEVSSAITVATRLFPGVSASFLGGTAVREYGMYLKPGKNEDGTDKPVYYGHGTAGGTSSAVGLYQFTTGTMLDMLNPKKNPNANAIMTAIQSATGIDVSGMSPQERLALRKDPAVSTIMAAAYADANRRVLEKTVGRQVNDAELYMAHFFGLGGATQFLTAMRQTPNDPVTDHVDEGSVKANRSVFFDRNGNPRSVAQVYNMISTRFLASPSQVAYEDAKTWEREAKRKQGELTRNPIGEARRDGTHAVVPLDQPNAWEARGATFRSVADYYKVERSEMKPFDADTEVAALRQQLKDGTTENALELLRNITRMDKAGPGAGAAALDQLGEKNSAYGVAGQLVGSDVPDNGTAAVVVRGQKRIDKDKTELQRLGTEAETPEVFNKTVGSALMSLPPGAAQALRQAANAHYVDTAVNDGVTTFDQNLYKKSVQAVMGGAQTERVAEVNGTATVLPAGVKGEDFERAVDNLTEQDLMRFSVTATGQQVNLPPVYNDGKPVPAIDIATQGKLRYVGGDRYQVQMTNNKFLMVPILAPGGLQPYVIEMKRETVAELAGRKGPTASYGPPMEMFGGSMLGGP